MNESKTTFTWEGEPCARLSIYEQEGEYFFCEEGHDPSYGWMPTRIERFDSADKAELRYQDRCDWFDATGCIELINHALA